MISKKLQGIDKNIKTKFLRWKYMIHLGMDDSEASVRHISKYYKKLRTYFSNQDVSSIEKLYLFLIKSEFHPHKAEEISKILYVTNFLHFDLLTSDLIEIISIKNTEIEFYTKRGWDIKNAMKKSKDFFRKCNLSIQKKKANSPSYDEWYKTTRKIGAAKSYTVNKNANGSKMEKSIRNMLSLNHSLQSFYSPCVHPKLNQIFHKKNYIHDFYVDSKYIIEYNGIYWHKDHFSFPEKFSMDDYMFEIKKAYNCLELVPRGKKYIVIWENDFETKEQIVNFLERIFDLDDIQDFYSSREIDIDLYDDYVKSQKKFLKRNKLFKDIVVRISEESHCVSKKVAAIAVKNGRIIATGINGSITGLVNCDEYWLAQHEIQKISLRYEEWIKTAEWRSQHIEWSNNNEVHAEQSLIAESVKNGIKLEDVDIYISLEPCIHCSKLLAALGPKNIFYVNSYDRAGNNHNLINNSGIIIQKI